MRVNPESEEEKSEVSTSKKQYERNYKCQMYGRAGKEVHLTSAHPKLTQTESFEIVVKDPKYTHKTPLVQGQMSLTSFSRTQCRCMKETSRQSSQRVVHKKCSTNGKMALFVSRLKGVEGKRRTEKEAREIAANVSKVFAHSTSLGMLFLSL